MNVWTLNIFHQVDTLLLSAGFILLTQIKKGLAAETLEQEVDIFHFPGDGFTSSSSSSQALVQEG